MPDQTAIKARAAALRARFEAAGADVVETPVLQPAETLLDLYGEDIRARAYVTSDAVRGEQMLRPDFTVPVVQMHMETGAEPARYTYAGKVFRRQEHDPERPSEYVQVGYELFDRADPAAADAEVFSLISEAVNGLPVRAVTGDIGILAGAVAGLRTSDARRRALMRHIWRPVRFRRLLERFAGHVAPSAERVRLLAGQDPLAGAGPRIGLRSREEVEERLRILRDDAAQSPLSETELSALEALLSVRDTLPSAMSAMRDIAVDLRQISQPLDRLAARADALAARGVDIERLDFEASYGRTSMEYYDGFVFGFSAIARPDLPPVATGGRYDALTRQLGRGREIPAVGAVLRPDLLLALEAGA